MKILSIFSKKFVDIFKKICRFFLSDPCTKNQKYAKFIDSLYLHFFIIFENWINYKFKNKMKLLLVQFFVNINLILAVLFFVQYEAHLKLNKYLSNLCSISLCNLNLK